MNKYLLNYVQSFQEKELVDTKIKEKGLFSESLFRKIRMLPSLYEYMDIRTFIYEDDMFSSVWEDLEGMGYGWRWLRYEEEEWHSMMCKIIDDELKFLKKMMNKSYYYIFEKNETLYIYLITGEKDCRDDILFRFSNKELSLFK